MPAMEATRFTAKEATTPFMEETARTSSTAATGMTFWWGDQLAITDWYADKKNHVEEFKTANGDELDEKRVEQLRQAMAAFAPPALSADMTLSSNIQHQLASPLAAAWEHGHD